VPYIIMFQLIPLERAAKAADAGKSSASHQKTAASFPPVGAAASAVPVQCDFDLNHMSLVSVGPYEDFAVGIVSNCREYVFLFLLRYCMLYSSFSS